MFFLLNDRNSSLFWILFKIYYILKLEKIILSFMKCFWQRKDHCLWPKKTLILERKFIKNSIENNLTTIVKLKLIENYNSFRNVEFETVKLLSI